VECTNLSPADLAARLRDAGLRVTSQRLDVYEALASSGLHLSPEQTLARVRGRHPTISANTVYQVLETLVGAGAIRRADTGAGARRYDANMEPHHHLVCTTCGKQVDVPCDEGPTHGHELDDDLGFTIAEARVTYMGTCPDCARAATG